MINTFFRNNPSGSGVIVHWDLVATLSIENQLDLIVGDIIKAIEYGSIMAYYPTHVTEYEVAKAECNIITTTGKTQTFPYRSLLLL